MRLSRTRGMNFIPLGEKKSFLHNCSQISRNIFAFKKILVEMRIYSMEGVTGSPGWAVELSRSKTNGKTNCCPKEQTGRTRQEAGAALPLVPAHPAANKAKITFPA